MPAAKERLAACSSSSCPCPCPRSGIVQQPSIAVLHTRAQACSTRMAWVHARAAWIRRGSIDPICDVFHSARRSCVSTRNLVDPNLLKPKTSCWTKWCRVVHPRICFARWTIRSAWINVVGVHWSSKWWMEWNRLSVHIAGEHMFLQVLVAFCALCPCLIEVQWLNQNVQVCT